MGVAVSSLNLGAFNPTPCAMAMPMTANISQTATQTTNAQVVAARQ
jgi:hypothetical protein